MRSPALCFQYKLSLHNKPILTLQTFNFKSGDLGEVKKKLLIFFLNSRALFNFFVPRKLDRRGTNMI